MLIRCVIPFQQIKHRIVRFVVKLITTSVRISRFPQSFTCNLTAIRFLRFRVRRFVFLLSFPIFRRKGRTSTIRFLLFNFQVSSFFRNQWCVPRETRGINFHVQLSVSKPKGSRQSASATFMRVPFVSTVGTITIRRVKVNTPFRVETIVTHGSSSNIVVWAFIFWLLSSLPSVSIRAMSRDNRDYV